MTAAELAFLNRLKRRAAAESPTLARRHQQAYELIREVLTEAELDEALRTGQVEALIRELLSDERLDPPLESLRRRIDRLVMDTAEKEAKAALPSFMRPTVFNVLSSHVVEAARKLDTRVIEGLKTEIRETVRQHATEGLKAGVGPREVARRLRQVIGLAPNQEKAVANFRRLLEAGDTQALRRALRDRRFDATLKRALGPNGTGLNAGQVDRMVTAYRKRMVAFNAETHARTVALDAQKLGQRLAWQDAVARGIVKSHELQREWLAVGGPGGDGRNRPEHLALHGTRVGFDEPFPNGELVPGDSTFNCRCVARVTLAASARRQAA